MSTLTELKKSEQSRLREQSFETLVSLKGKALDCIVEMHKRRITVQQVTIRRDHVTIEIDKPGDLLQGSIHVTRVNGRYREVIKVTSVLGCQVQWVEQEAHPFLRGEV